MRFEEFYEIKMGVPKGVMPTFRYVCLSHLGLFGEFKYGSIRPRGPVAMYSAETIEKLLGDYIRTNFETDAYKILCTVILHKGTSEKAVQAYITGELDSITVGEGIALSCTSGTPEMQNLDTSLPIPEGDDVHAFLCAIEELRFEYANYKKHAQRNNWGFNLKDPDCKKLFKDFKHRFVSTADHVPSDTTKKYTDRIKEFQRHGIQLRRTTESKNGLLIIMGNGSINIAQRKKSVKVTANFTGIKGQPWEGTASGPKTIDELLTTVLTAETVFMQTKDGYYDTDKNTQYCATRMRSWLGLVAATYELNIHKGQKGTDDITVLNDADDNAILKMTTAFMHSEVTFGTPETGIETYFIRHDTDEVICAEAVDKFFKERGAK